LWVRLQIEALWNDCLNDEGIVKALNDLPKDLNATYQRCLQRIPEITCHMAPRVLTWVCCAVRPLHVSELQEAVAFDLQDHKWSSLKVPSSSLVVGCCANLVTLDANDQCVRFAHPSVKKFLTDVEQGVPPEYFVEHSTAQLECGEYCVNYLSFSDFQQQLQAYSSVRVVDVPSPITSLTVLPLGRLTEQAVRLFSRKSGAQRTQVYLPRTTQSPMVESEFQRYRLLPYARENWTNHTKLISSESLVWSRFVELAIQPNRTWAIHPWSSGGQSLSSHLHGLLAWATRKRHISLLKLLLGSCVDYRLKDFCNLPLVEDGLPALHVASRLGYEDVVLLLLQVCAIDSRGHDGWTPLHYAAEKGHVGVARILLSIKPIDIDSKYELLSTKRRPFQFTPVLPPPERNSSFELSSAFRPIVLAARNGHVELVQLFTVGFGSDEARDTLWHVASAGHETMVRFMVEIVGVDLDAKDINGTNALMHAVSGGHEAVVRFLIESDIDVNARDLVGRTALSWAAQTGHEGIVMVLLGRVDIKINTMDVISRTALFWAAGCGNEGVVRLLLARADIQVNTQDTDNRTAISWASWNGHAGVVKQLLGKLEIQVNTRDDDGRTALSWASEYGHE